MHIPLVWWIKQPDLWVFVTLLFHILISAGIRICPLCSLVNALASFYMLELNSAAPNTCVFPPLCLLQLLSVHALLKAQCGSYFFQLGLSVSSVHFYVTWFHCQIIWYAIKLLSVFYQIASEYRHSLVKFTILLIICCVFCFVICLTLPNLHSHYICSSCAI